jgi:hypothetical protein
MLVPFPVVAALLWMRIYVFLELSLIDSAKLTPKIGKSLSDEIKDRIKSMNIDRYKIICVLTIGQMGNQGLMLSSRCTINNIKLSTLVNLSIYVYILFSIHPINSCRTENILVLE